MAEFDNRQYVVRRADISLLYISEVVTLNVAAGASYVKYISAPVGSICRTQLMLFEVGAPVGAMSGTHDLRVESYIGFMRGVSNFGDIITYQYGHWLHATSAKYPPNDTAQALLGRDVIFTQQPLGFRYYNDTDVVNGTYMQIEITAEKQIV